MAEKRKDKKGRILRDGETQRPDGRYRYRYTDTNSKRHEVYAWRLVETDRTPPGKKDDLPLREKEKQINRDLEDGIRTADSRKTTLDHVFDLYISSRCDLKQTTKENYKYMYGRYVSDTLGKKKVVGIKYSDIKHFYNDLIRVKGLKASSIENIHTVLHPVFTLAVRDGLIRSNPTDGLMREIKQGNAWEKPHRHALEIEEQENFIKYVSNSDLYRHWLPLFTVLLGTGCRVGELIGLRWQDCDFKGGTISINHALVYKKQENGKCEMHISTPKTEAGCRTIPMLDEVRAALLREKQGQMKKGYGAAVVDGYTGFCFLNRDGNPRNPVCINKAIKRVIRAYNEREAEMAAAEHREPALIRHFSCHNLRHTFCTRLCENVN